MTEPIYFRPRFDEYSDQPGLSRSMERILDQTGFSQFKTRHPEYFDSEKNAETMVRYLNFYEVPCSLNNCEISFRELSKQNALELRPQPSVTEGRGDRGIIKVPSTGTVKINYPVGNQAERQLAAEGQFEESFIDKIQERGQELRDARALSEIGKPISPELKKAMRQSLQDVRQERAEGHLDPQQVKEARMKVILDNPNIRRDGPEMARLIQLELARN